MIKTILCLTISLIAMGFGSRPCAAQAAKPPKLEVASELTTRNARSEESSLGDLVADSVRNVEGSDIAFLPASSFAEITIPKGSASIDEVLKVLAFKSHTVVIVNLTGLQVRQALAHGLALVPQRNSAFPHVSGLSASIDPGQEGIKRVVSVKVGGSAIDDKKIYTVAMPSILADGALTYYKVWRKGDTDQHDTGKTLEQALTDYLKGKKVIGDRTEERLAFKK